MVRRQHGRQHMPWQAHTLANRSEQKSCTKQLCSGLATPSDATCALFQARQSNTVAVVVLFTRMRACNNAKHYNSTWAPGARRDEVVQGSCGVRHRQAVNVSKGKRPSKSMLASGCCIGNAFRPSLAEVRFSSVDLGALKGRCPTMRDCPTMLMGRKSASNIMQMCVEIATTQKTKD